MPHLHRKHAGTQDTLDILRHELAQADDALPRSGPADEAIHSARKSLKKCRATLRLLRRGLSAARYRRLNHKLRDAARPLSSVRDARVLLDTLQQLRGRHVTGRSAEVANLRQALQREYATACEQFSGSARGLRQTREALRASRRRAARLKVRRAGWAVLGPSLLKVYKLGREAMHAAQRRQGDEELHEWRKQVKYLRYQVRMLQPVRPDFIKRWEQQLHALSDALGDDHDLSVLRQKLLAHSQHTAAHQQTTATDTHTQPLLALINARRQALQYKAQRLGAKLYGKRPAQLAKRIRSDWKRWKASRQPVGSSAL